MASPALGVAYWLVHMDRTRTTWDKMVREALKCKGIAALDCGKRGKEKLFRYVYST